MKEYRVDRNILSKPKGFYYEVKVKNNRRERIMAICDDISDANRIVKAMNHFEICMKSEMGE